MTKLERIIKECLKKQSDKGGHSGRITCYGDVCVICQYDCICPHDKKVTAEQLLLQLTTNQRRRKP